MSWSSKERTLILGLISSLGAAKDRKLSAEALYGYEIGLDGLSVDDVARAVRRSLQESRFMPAPSELRELAGVLPPESRAERALASVDMACRRVGPYESPDFDDPLINATIYGLGGWPRVCALPVEEFNKWYRRDFVRMYVSFTKLRPPDHLTRPLVGLIQQENAVKGIDCRPVEVKTGLPWAERKGRQAISRHNSPVDGDLVKRLTLD